MMLQLAQNAMIVELQNQIVHVQMDTLKKKMTANVINVTSDVKPVKMLRSVHFVLIPDQIQIVRYVQQDISTMKKIRIARYALINSLIV